jgi:hypothetical protein
MSRAFTAPLEILEPRFKGGTVHQIALVSGGTPPPRIGTVEESGRRGGTRPASVLRRMPAAVGGARLDPLPRLTRVVCGDPGGGFGPGLTHQAGIAARNPR